MLATIASNVGRQPEMRPLVEAESLVASGRFEEAFALVRDLDDDPMAALLVGRCLVGMSRFEEAMARFDVALGDVLEPKARALERAGRSQQADRVYQQLAAMAGQRR